MIVVVLERTEQTSDAARPSRWPTWTAREEMGGVRTSGGAGAEDELRHWRSVFFSHGGANGGRPISQASGNAHWPTRAAAPSVLSSMRAVYDAGELMQRGMNCNLILTGGGVDTAVVPGGIACMLWLARREAPSRADAATDRRTAPPPRSAN